MSRVKQRLFLVLFIVGIGVYASSIVLGVVHAIVTSGRPPGLSSLDYASTIRGYIERDDFDSVMREAEMALTLDHAMEHVAHNTMATALRTQGKTDEAIDHFRQALAFQPNYLEAQLGLGAALASKGQELLKDGNYELAEKTLNESVARFQLTLQLRPNLESAEQLMASALQRYAQAIVAHGRQLSRDRKHEQALAKYRTAIKVNKNSAEAYNYLAEILATHPADRLRNGAEAVKYAEQLRSMPGGDRPIALQTLAAAYAEVGQFERAVSTIDVAIEKARVTNQQMIGALQSQRRLYLARKPYRRSAWASASSP